jgi:hypothetical protein
VILSPGLNVCTTHVLMKDVILELKIKNTLHAWHLKKNFNMKIYNKFLKAKNVLYSKDISMYGQGHC